MELDDPGEIARLWTEYKDSGDTPLRDRLANIVASHCQSALFPVQNAVVKLLTSIYPFQEVVWVRLATHLVLMCVIFLPRRGLALLRTRAPVQQVICSAGLLGATFFFFSAAKSVGVTEAIAISFISPLVVTFLAWPILGERITLVRLASVVIGFAGVLIVIRPGSSVFQWASLLIVASAVSYAVYQIIVRRVAAVDSPATTAFYSALGCTLVTSLFVPFNWKTPDHFRLVFLPNSDDLTDACARIARFLGLPSAVPAQPAAPPAAPPMAPTPPG